MTKEQKYVLTERSNLFETTHDIVQKKSSKEKELLIRIIYVFWTLHINALKVKENQNERKGSKRSCRANHTFSAGIQLFKKNSKAIREERESHSSFFFSDLQLYDLEICKNPYEKKRDIHQTFRANQKHSLLKGIETFGEMQNQIFKKRRGLSFKPNTMYMRSKSWQVGLNASEGSATAIAGLVHFKLDEVT